MSRSGDTRRLYGVISHFVRFSRYNCFERIKKGSLFLSFLCSFCCLTFDAPTTNAAQYIPKNISIVVNQLFVDTEGNSIHVRKPFFFEESMKKFVKYAGLSVVTPQENADITVTVEAEGRAMGAYYSDNKYHYTAAELKGTILFETKHTRFHRREFSGHSGGRKTGFDLDEGEMYVEGLPYEISSANSDYTLDPSHAPFYSAFSNSSFRCIFIEMLSRICGTDFLVQILENFGVSSSVREDAASALIESSDQGSREVILEALDEEILRFIQNYETWRYHNITTKLIKLLGDKGGLWAIEALTRATDVSHFRIDAREAIKKIEQRDSLKKQEHDLFKRFFRPLPGDSNKNTPEKKLDRGTI